MNMTVSQKENILNQREKTKHEYLYLLLKKIK